MDSVINLLANRNFIALAVPIILLLVGGLGKKLVRHDKSWHRKDFYLGVDAALAAISAALIHIYDVTKTLKSTFEAGNSASPQINKLYATLVATVGFIVITLGLLMFVIGIHQNWESKDTNRAGQWFWLVIFSNMIGLGLMSAFVAFLKGVE